MQFQDIVGCRETRRGGSYWKENSIFNDKELRVYKEGEKLQVETRGNDSNLSIGKLVRAITRFS